jgi:hypothetical protein
MSPHAWHTAALLRPPQLRTPLPMKRPADADGGNGGGGGGGVFSDGEEEAEFWGLLNSAPEQIGPAVRRNATSAMGHFNGDDDGWLAVARRLRLRRKTSNGLLPGRLTQEKESSEVTLPQVDPDGSRSAQGQSTSEDTKGKGTSKGSGKNDADDGFDDRPVITPMWSRGGDDSRFWKNVEGKDNPENGQGDDDDMDKDGQG